jgi:DUF1680 family protein
MDRALPEAEIRGFEPYEGRVEVRAHTRTRIALRVPGYTGSDAISATVNGSTIEARLKEGYLFTPEVEAGDLVRFAYPLPERIETISIGNEGFQQYRYTVTWRGSTVLRITPGENPSLGRSHLMAEPARLYYGAEGPHPLYQREGILSSAPSPGPLNVSSGPDIW